MVKTMRWRKTESPKRSQTLGYCSSLSDALPLSYRELDMVSLAMSRFACDRDDPLGSAKLKS